MIVETENFRKCTGEPNGRTDLQAFGLVRLGNHSDIKTATITVAGKETEIKVFPIISKETSGETVTILRPNKVAFREALRELAENKSLKPLVPIWVPPTKTTRYCKAEGARYYKNYYP